MDKQTHSPSFDFVKMPNDEREFPRKALFPLVDIIAVISILVYFFLLSALLVSILAFTWSSNAALAKLSYEVSNLAHDVETGRAPYPDHPVTNYTCDCDCTKDPTTVQTTPTESINISTRFSEETEWTTADETSNASETTPEKITDESTSTSTTELATKTSEISSTPEPEPPTTTTTTTTERLQYSTTTPPLLLQADKMIEKLNNTGVINGYYLDGCNLTCKLPKIIKAYGNLTTGGNRELQFEALMSGIGHDGNDEQDARRYISYSMIATLYSDYLDQTLTTDLAKWQRPLPGCGNPINDRC